MKFFIVYKERETEINKLRKENDKLRKQHSEMKEEFNPDEEIGKQMNNVVKI